MVLEERTEVEGLLGEEIRTRSTGLPRCLQVLRITTVVSSPFSPSPPCLALGSSLAEAVHLLDRYYR